MSEEEDLYPPGEEPGSQSNAGCDIDDDIQVRLCKHNVLYVVTMGLEGESAYFTMKIIVKKLLLAANATNRPVVNIETARQINKIMHPVLIR